MRQKETLDGAVKYNNLYLIIGFERRDNLIQLWNGFRTKDIQGRMVKCNPPVGWRASFETNLPDVCASLMFVSGDLDYGLGARFLADETAFVPRGAP